MYMLVPLADDAQRQATHFKIRVLGLIDTFIKKQPSSPFIARLIFPLVDLITSSSSDERQLSDRAKSLIKSRIGKLKDVPPAVDTEQLTKVLGELHSLARKARSSDVCAILNHCSSYLVRVLLHAGQEESVRDIYAQSLKDFITRKNSPLNTNFFQDFFRLHAASAWGLRDVLLGLTKNSVNVYRHFQVFHLCQVLISQLPATVSFVPYHALVC
jgi:DNA polymerase phi